MHRLLLGGRFFGLLIFGKLGLGQQRLGHITELIDGHQNAEIHGDGDDQEIQDRAEHRAERHGRTVERDRQQTVHIRFAEDHGDEWVDDAVHNRVDHSGDGTAHNDADRHVDHVAARNELLESFNHDSSRGFPLLFFLFSEDTFINPSAVFHPPIL